MQVVPNQTRNQAIAIGVTAILAMLVTLCIPPFKLTNANAFPYLLMELFTAVISLLVVVVSYHSLARQPYLAQANLLIFGFTVVAVCDLAHALTYPGLPGFVAVGGVPRTIFFRLMGRSIEAATLIAIASYVVLPGTRLVWLLAGIVVCGVIGWFGAFHIDWFPDVTRNGRQTTFKTSYEYALAALNTGAAVALWREAVRHNSSRRYLLSCSCILMAAGNIVLAQYRSPADFTFTFGQFFKVAGYILVYRAAFVYAIKKPHLLLQESEQRLRNSEEQLKALGDNLPEGMVYQLTIDPDGKRRFLYFSAGIDRLTGNELSAQEVMRDSNTFYARIFAEDLPALRSAQRQSIAGMSLFNIIIRMHGGRGELRYLHLCSRPRCQADGTVVWDGIAIDVTEREQIEAELRQLNIELEHRVEQRTAALTQANRSLESFSYMIAHDLRTPIRHIDGYAVLLKQDHARQLDGDGQQLLEGIRSNVTAMHQLIDGILAISRLEHTPLKVGRVDMSELANQIATELQMAEPQRGMKILIWPGMYADADPALIRNVLANLLSNAWKFTASQAIGYIEVGTLKRNGRQHEDPLEEVTFFVRDNGIGFTPHEADRLFDVFQRHPDHTHVAGHGIGLASVRSIIVNHGGKVWAEGAQGRGATFYFSLPVLQQRGVHSAHPDIERDSAAR